MCLCWLVGEVVAYRCALWLCISPGLLDCMYHAALGAFFCPVHDRASLLVVVGGTCKCSATADTAPDQPGVAIISTLLTLYLGEFSLVEGYRWL